MTAQAYPSISTVDPERSSTTNSLRIQTEPLPTITSRTDPRQRAKHDFRNTLQALVLAAEGGDMEYARGLLVDLEARYEAAAAIAKR